MAVHGFHRTLTGRIVLRVDEVEKGLLLLLLDQLVEFVAPDDPDPDADPLERLVGMDGSVDAPDDPALARLLPDAYTDDDEAAADFRRFLSQLLPRQHQHLTGAIQASYPITRPHQRQ